MEWIKKLQEILIADKYLIFYKIMKYPIPKRMEYFFFDKKINDNKNEDKKDIFSRSKKNKYMDEYISFINNFWKLYRSIPFIKQIFLCNSITFNALKKDSDIDLFIITKKDSIRRARLFSLIFFLIHWIKRLKYKIRKKFCLSFYVSEDNINLYNIMLSKSDIYLNYWLAHLVSVYEEKKNSINIYEKNPRFRVTMPNHPQKQCINIWNTIFLWNNKIKNILEKLFSWLIWKLIEEIIKTIWIPILKKKTKKLWKDSKWIIISDKMLKFYKDQREKIHLIYKVQSKTTR